MPVKVNLCWLVLLWLPVSFAMPDADIPKPAVKAVTSGDIASWG